MALGDDIRAFRKRRGLSQRELAERIGVRQRTVSDWETGKAAKMLQSLFRLFRMMFVDSWINKE